ncbi:cytosine permease [Lactobacillus sp. DCY120]|uniref:Cytosine permease n=1 Tax=Bombilactobacillus apium TaxID=2675299 RepID=A0A850R2Q3_9LACO|nr:cytosine permease [Bombilactobacillus apium]NVY96291.1 cytosine permease [Bombilactobacillus apium]
MKFFQRYAVPEAAQQMSNWDLFATWLGANANNGTWYIGGVIAACGLVTASSLLIVTGCCAYLLLMCVSLAGYQTKLPTMTLMRGAFGIRGSIIPSLINIVQFIGWTAVNTYIAALSVSYIFQELFHWSKNQHWGIIIGIIIMSILHLLSISLGERSVRLIERFGMILVTIFVIWESIVVLKMVPFSDLLVWRPSGHFRLPSGIAIDSLAAFNLAWVTAAADFSRYARHQKAATWASFWGANLGLIWFALMGIIATIASAILLGKFDPNNSDPSTVAAQLGLGVLALIVIMLTSTTANAVNLMAAGSAATNIFSKLPLKPALWIVTIAAAVVTFIPVYVTTFLETFKWFLDAIGMFLGPEVAIFLVDYFLIHHSHYAIDEFDQPTGPYWYFHGWHLPALGSWILGVGIYLGLKQVAGINQTVGATFITILITAAIYYAWRSWTVSRISRAE